MAKLTMSYLREHGHDFRPIRWQHGSARPGCECDHDFGHVGGTLAQAREHHNTHLREVQRAQKEYERHVYGNNVTRQVRITGTINDVVEVEVDADATDEEVIEQARNEWQYVEFEDLEGRIE